MLILKVCPLFIGSLIELGSPVFLFVMGRGTEGVGTRRGKQEKREERERVGVRGKECS